MSPAISLEAVYRLAGAVLAIVAWLDLRDRENPKRVTNALFWGAYATTLLLGSKLPDFVNGCLVIVLVLVGGLRGIATSPASAKETSSLDERLAGAARFGNRLFVPALLVPAATLGLTLFFRHVPAVSARVDPKNQSLIALALSALLALGLAQATLRQPRAAPALELRRLMNLVGWAAILPQLLAALGAIFAAAGVGGHVAALLGKAVPLDARLTVVVTYTVGMALFTIVMGNAFAAFPVMTAAVGLPLLVRRFGGDPVVVSAIGMLSGFCGTLMTPMAANYNVVPAALLELPDRNGVVRVQIPTALLLLSANTGLMYFLAFRR